MDTTDAVTTEASTKRQNGNGATAQSRVGDTC